MPAPAIIEAPSVDVRRDLGQVHANQLGILGGVEDQPLAAHLMKMDLVPHDL